MKKLQVTILSVCLFAANLVHAQSSETIRQYILRFKDIAIAEEQRTGVPAAITLAQGIHETGAGTSDLVVASNNHFGIKCHGDWTGETVSHDDDSKGECFRKYPDPAQSYRDHSDFLRNRSHYASLFNIDPTDYEGWAYGLKKAGYATNPRYPQILIKLINDYNLQDYTLIALNRKKDSNGAIWASNTTKIDPPASQRSTGVTPKRNYPKGVFAINDTKVIYAKEGTPYLQLAEENNITLSRLFDFNDMKEQEVVAEDQLVYLQRKRRTGANEFHVVTPGETLQYIAQVEAIRLDHLLEYNHLKPGMEPEVGEKLFLSGKAPGAPKLAQLFNSIKNAFSSIAYKEPSVVLKSEPSYITHVVQPKETMYAIAKKYDVTVAELAKWNDIENTDLKVGQQLRIIKKTGNAVN
ncbi:MAG: glucosaminidase domain-containing protein [Candidatus Dadabacteria bacterium]